MNKIIKKSNKFLLSVFIFFCTYMLTACVMDRTNSFCIRNSSSDTLYIELSESDTLDNLIYWSKEPNETMPPIWPTDTTWVYINGKKVVVDNCFYAFPDSIIHVSPYSFDNKDTCYIYAIKKQIITRYTLDEIRVKKLYDRQAVTAKDFHHRLFEYRPTSPKLMP